MPPASTPPPPAAATPPRVFLAHRHADADAARALATALRAEHGIDVWFDGWEIVGAETFVAKMEQGLVKAHGAIVLVGRTGVGSWTYEEYAAMLKRAVEHRASAEEQGPRPFVLPVDQGRLLNAFELAEMRARESGRTVDAELQEHLRDWHARRVRFETVAGGSSRFHYGALNVGGMGAPRYGRYCVVDGRRAGEAAPDPVWLVEDSLDGMSRIRDRAGRLLQQRLRQWVAPADAPGALVVSKHPEVDASSPDLSTRVCSDSNYVEALSIEPLLRSNAIEVRSETDLELQRRAAQAELFGAPEVEMIDLELHERLRAEVARCGVTWSAVPLSKSTMHHAEEVP